MGKTLLIAIALIALLALYKAQHVKPVEDPKDSPIFQQRLQSSLDKFQDGASPPGQERMQGRGREGGAQPSSGTVQRAKDLVVSGVCGQITLTWVEEQKIAKEKIVIKRRSPGEDYTPLPAQNIYEREEEQGVRYWVSESGLSDGVKYDYLVSFKDDQAQAKVKGPVSITLSCTERDKALLAQRDKMVKDYYQKKGLELKEYGAQKPSAPAGQAVTADLVVAGRCGAVTLTWTEVQMLDKESITITRITQGEERTLLKNRKIYHREEEMGGIRYWAADDGLNDGASYQYLVSFKDDQGKEVVRGPAFINLGCTEKDREMIAQRDKMLKEYYQKQTVPGTALPPAGTSPYQLSKEVYTVEAGSSPWKGAKGATVTMVVFTDFECVHCASWSETLETMLKTFPRDLKVVFKNYTIPYHKNAEVAALAALAAGEQGKFWEMHDLLFRNQSALGKDNIIGYARSLNLDMAGFQKSLASAELKKKLDEDVAQGKTLHVQNLPTTFINGRSFMGSPPPLYIKGLIEGMLKK